MTFHVKNFSAASMQFLANDINAYLAANPGFTAISIALSEQGAAFDAILLYSA